MQQVTMDMHRRPHVKRWFVLSDCDHNCNGSAASIPMSTRRKIRSALLYLLQVYRQTNRATIQQYAPPGLSTISSPCCYDWRGTKCGLL